MPPMSDRQRASREVKAYYPPPRTPMGLLGALEDRNVEFNPRYAPNGGKTYCNIFVWDVTTALMCEVPHWVKDGKAVEPFTEGAFETTANMLIREWLPRSPWFKTLTPLERAVAGYPVIAAWYNPSGRGHVAMVAPEESELYIYQAGAECLAMAPIAKGFGKRRVEFWTHD